MAPMGLVNSNFQVDGVAEKSFLPIFLFSLILQIYQGLVSRKISVPCLVCSICVIRHHVF